jgi:hypothetical protein
MKILSSKRYNELVEVYSSNKSLKDDLERTQKYVDSYEEKIIEVVIDLQGVCNDLKKVVAKKDIRKKVENIITKLGGKIK